MTPATRQRYDELLLYLMNYCYDHNIGYEFKNKLPYYTPSISYQIPGNFIMINADWDNEYEIPFMFAHEIGHILTNDPYLFHATKIGKIQGEYSANCFAIDLLLQYCEEHNFHFSNYYSFAKSFGIPQKLFYLFEKIG